MLALLVGNTQWGFSSDTPGSVPLGCTSLAALKHMAGGHVCACYMEFVLLKAALGQAGTSEHWDTTPWGPV